MIKLSQSTLSNDELGMIQEVIQDGYLGMGRFVQDFEKAIKSYLETDRHVISVNTGTSALHLAIQACGIGQGDEVLVPSVTYVGCFQAISATGATPIACDITLENGIINLQDMDLKHSERTKAIMAVHYAGSVDGISEIRSFARKKNLRLIEDAAHSFGGEYGDQKIGATGDIVCFSFDSIKNITCGEGGAIVTADDVVANRVRDMRLLSIEKDTEKRFQKQRSWDFDVKDQGWRYHLSNIYAAIGLAQLKKIDDFREKRCELARIYIEKLSKIDQISCMLSSVESINPHIFPIRVLDGQCDALKAFLFDQQIETGKHYKPNHLLSAFRQGPLFNAEMFWEQELTLPLHCNLEIRDIDYICQKIKDFFDLGGE